MTLKPSQEGVMIMKRLLLDLSLLAFALGSLAGGQMLSHIPSALANGGHSSAPEATAEPQADASLVKRQADTLMAFLEQTKDKRVEKVALRKYNWAGAAKEEALNYNLKIADAKYTVVVPGRDMPADNYIVFLVKLLKSDPGFLVADDDRDGIVDRGS